MKTGLGGVGGTKGCEGVRNGVDDNEGGFNVSGLGWRV
jgi:hypothetical protein